MTFVKICGCMQVADAIAAKKAGADFIGVMFAPSSRRRVSTDEAAAIVESVGQPMREIEQASPPPRHPGVFDEADAWFRHGAEALERLLVQKRPLVVGVFAHQPIEEVNEVAEEVGLDLVQLSGGESWEDCMLATRQAVKVLHQQPGMSADDVVAHVQAGAAIWAVARAVSERMPIWLAGGLSPENVAEAIGTVRPWLVDVSTGVETDGAKDAAKIVAFVAKAKGGA
jgi:phosphoribosylanthranilate isomerase